MALTMGPDGELTTDFLLREAELNRKRDEAIAALDAKYRQQQYRKDEAFDALVAACEAADLQGQHADGCRWWVANISELRTEKQRQENDAKCNCYLASVRAALALAREPEGRT